MNIEGLDYNTQREPLVLPEYGREIQNMVDFTIMLPTKELRQRGANTIIKMMAVKVAQQMETADYMRTLWDHLYMMSKKKLDIDWPYDMNEAESILSKPKPMEINRGGQVYRRHYGRLLEEVFVKLQTMQPGPDRDELVRLTANQMKRDLVMWSHGSMDDEKVADDLARFTNGVIQLDLDNFRFEKVQLNEPDNKPAQQRKKKK